MLDLQLKQQQSLTLSPQMRQALAILQMSNETLEDYLLELSMENPLLDYTPASKFDYSLFSGKSINDQALSPLDYIDCRQNTLKHFLLFQIAPLHLTPQVQQTVLYLIECLDDHGYLCEATESLPGFISPSLFEKGLSVLQKLEPKGVGARTLKECLLLQLDPKDGFEQLCIHILNHYFDEITHNQLPQIARALELSLQDVQRVQSHICALNPRPSQGFSGNDPISHNKYLVPDIDVQKKDGRYLAILNNQSQPSYQINSYYLKLLQASKQSNGELHDYLLQKYRQVNWVIKCIAQRNQTLLSVAQALVSWQEGFFEKGPQELKPLKLQDLATSLGLAISTVSRTLKNKYLSCNHGVFAMQYFMDSSISSATQSRKSVKYLIQELIMQENKLRPYSDQQISNILARKGYPIARRTVTKYREQLGIGSTNIRKKYSN